MGKFILKKDNKTQEKPLTKKAFENLLRKAAQPLPDKKSVLGETETSGSHPSDGCSGTGTNQGKTEGAED